ncbi:MAG: ComF family protein [Clostridia bacterium]|nr:ComF family protein [Clostridia bacterium]
MKLSDLIGNALCSNKCINCGELFEIYQEYEACPACDSILRENIQNNTVQINDINISADKFLFFYNNATIKKLVLDMKNFPLGQNCRYFARIAYECIVNDPVFSDFDIVTHCPRNPHKESVVGYDHSACFAENIATFCEKPFFKLIKRKIGGKEQKKLNLTQRISNVHNKFYFNRKYSCKGKTVLLVDDIVTTGSTVKECARILKEAGASKVLALFILD